MSNNKSKSSRHSRDISSKTVFRNPVLCAQFIRDNINVPILKNVRPEDIEDVSERYLPYLGTEFESDTVKRIHLYDREKEQENEPVFLVSLVEHKSLVDYDVAMQLLRYMMCIWTEYRKEMEVVREGITRRKSFRYPVIIPIVYYEGRGRWTADIQLKDRISRGDMFEKWIPDFCYEVIRIHDYSNKELLERGNEMSLIMLLNKIQNESDLEEFKQISGQDVDRIVQGSPGSVVEILAAVAESLCRKLGATDAETKQCERKVRGREMGYLFENMEKMNIQEERKKTAEARKELEEMRMKLEETQEKLEKAQKETGEAQEKLEKAQRKTDEAEEKGIRMLIESFQEMGISKEDTVSRLADKVEPGIRIRELVDRYWR